MKKAYAKVKAREADAAADGPAHSAALLNQPAAPPASLELHPDRQAMLNEPEPILRKDGQATRRYPSDDVNGFRTRKRPKTSTYRKEMELAKKRQEDMEARRKAREQREKDRRAMSKARRPGKDGKMRLGRQSKVLLSRVQALMAQS